jgi:hypothetical protein
MRPWNGVGNGWKEKCAIFDINIPISPYFAHFGWEVGEGYIFSFLFFLRWFCDLFLRKILNFILNVLVREQKLSQI